MLRTISAAILAAGVALPASAAPFCAVFSFGSQCWYYTLQSCEEAAGSAGACVVNQQEVQPPNGGAPFCVVTGISTNCWYYSAESCREMAASSGGACYVNTAAVP